MHDALRKCTLSDDKETRQLKIITGTGRERIVESGKIQRRGLRARRLVVMDGREPILFTNK